MVTPVLAVVPTKSVAVMVAEPAASGAVYSPVAMSILPLVAV